MASSNPAQDSNPHRRQAGSYKKHACTPCRSWLASDSVLKPTTRLEAQIAGKPAPTKKHTRTAPVGAGLPAMASSSPAQDSKPHRRQAGSYKKTYPASPVGAGLPAMAPSSPAQDSKPIAGKPAPTKKHARTAPVGAGLPAIASSSPAQGSKPIAGKPAPTGLRWVLG